MSQGLRAADAARVFMRHEGEEEEEAGEGGEEEAPCHGRA